MYELIEPNAWVALRLPSDNLKVLQVIPNTTISLGKYGSFPSNLIIERPYNATFELEDKRDGESFNRLRIVPHTELYADVLAEEAAATKKTSNNGVVGAGDGSNGADDDGVPLLQTDGDVEYSVVNPSGEVVARSSHEVMDEDARQTLTMEEIEDLKREGAAAGKDLITKLMLRHTALDLKTSFSLSKYKLLKTRKYIRRFTVLPYDPTLMGTYLLEDKDAGSKTLEMREEMVALVGCWANVHYGGAPDVEPPPQDPHYDAVIQEKWRNGEKDSLPEAGRWLVVDDTGGLLIAAMAEKMGILHPNKSESPEGAAPVPPEVNGHSGNHVGGNHTTNATQPAPANGSVKVEVKAEGDVGKDEARPEDKPAADTDTVMLDGPSGTAEEQPEKPRKPRSNKRVHDFHVPYSRTNTITAIHPNSQANLSYLKQYGYDSTNPNHPPHPLLPHLMTLTWLQLLSPESDTVYASPPPSASAEEVMSWKANRRGNYHRKRRRWVRTRHAVDTARAGNFSGLVVASSMDPVSVLRHALPLLAGGAPVAVYSPALEPLARLADCYSVARRGAWIAADDPAGEDGTATAEAAEVDGADDGAPRLVRREGSEEFPVNPTLLLGVSIQSSKVRKWQVLPNRTHPVMTSRGGSEGFVLTGWKAVPAEGRIEARGKFMKRQKR